MLTAQSPLDMKNISNVGSCYLIMIYSGVENDVPNLPTIDSIICSSFVKGCIMVVAESGLSLLKDL